MPTDPLACKYAEICQLPATTGGYCVLHYPDPGKNPDVFQNKLQEYLASGRSDFRRVQFLQHGRTPFNGRTFPGPVDFRGARFPEGLELKGATIPNGLRVEAGEISHIDLDEATVHGAVEIIVSVSIRDIQAKDATFHNKVIIRIKRADNAYLGADFREEVTIRGVYRLDFSFDGGTIHGLLDLRECTFLRHPVFHAAVFGSHSEIDLSKSQVHDGGILVAGHSIPAAVHLNGTKIKGFTVLRAEMGRPRLLLVALDSPPEFDGTVSLTNVDVRRSRLIGNPLRTMEMTNVQWFRWRGRNILYDEAAVRGATPLDFALPRRRNVMQVVGHTVGCWVQWYQRWIRRDFPVTNLKEAYQDLKETYHRRGDHAMSGDFHFGEMEMKRCEYGWPWRILCTEFLYWALSGYGTRYLRAGLVLMLTALVFAYGYLKTNPAVFNSDFSESLQFSLKVMTLQRPVAPGKLNEVAEWLQIAQTILGPVQIALFGLALRMRLKR